MASRDSKTYGKPFEREEPDYYRARHDLAEEHIKEGKTYKHAWYLAFQAFPRKYVDVPLSTTGDTETQAGSPRPRLPVLPEGI